MATKRKTDDQDYEALSPPELKRRHDAIVAAIAKRLVNKGKPVGYIPAVNAAWLCQEIDFEDRELPQDNYGDNELQPHDLPSIIRSLCQTKHIGTNYDYVNVKLTDEELDELVKQAKPSGFGDLLTATTIVDDSVRKALEVTDHPLIATVQQNTSETIQDLAKYVFNTDTIVIKPKKINIYLEGGHFKEHVDTPVMDHTFLGTAVVEVPTMRGRGKTDSDSGALCLKSMDTWITADNIEVFVPYLPHRVNPVHKGDVRVSVAFELFRADTSSESSVQPPLSPHRSSPMYYVVRSVRQELEKMAKTQTKHVAYVGLILNNKYSSKQELYGSDKRLLEELSHHKLKSTQMSVYVDFECSRDPTGYDRDYLDATVYSKPCKKRKLGDIEDLKIPFYVLDNDALVLLKSEYQTGIEYTGNESQSEREHMMYYATALVVTL